MLRALIALMVILQTGTAGPGRFQFAKAAIAGTSEGDMAAAELLQLTNQARAQAGAPALQMDDGLAHAARLHAERMVSAGRIAHDFLGEPSLPQRLAASSSLHLDRAGENLALASTLEQVQHVLMNSPPHRANLMEPGYNVAGIAVLRHDSRLYVVEDFAHGLPVASSSEAEDAVMRSLATARSDSQLPGLARTDSTEARESACAMAQTGSLEKAVPPGRYMLRYNTMQPETLPASAMHAIADRSIRSVSVGACYSRTAMYPDGVYWVALILD